jgi:flagellar M-ring protein FliF
MVVLVMLLFILRPMVVRLTAPLAGSEDGLALVGSDGAPTGREDVQARAALPSGLNEEAVVMENVEGVLKASSLRRLTGLVERHPEESLSVVRGWLRQEQA